MTPLPAAIARTGTTTEVGERQAPGYLPSVWLRTAIVNLSLKLRIVP